MQLRTACCVAPGSFRQMQGRLQGKRFASESAWRLCARKGTRDSISQVLECWKCCIARPIAAACPRTVRCMFRPSWANLETAPLQLDFKANNCFLDVSKLSRSSPSTTR